MNYQVLARKWRPKTFAEVVGQEHVLTALANGLSLGRIHHAYLFSGTRGIGKTSIARLLAKGLNCKDGITAMPCGVCNNCREIEQGCFFDLIEIDAASRTKVEDTLELLDNIQYSPARGHFKVYLIDEVHMLSRHSFNALLKTLEEPPAHIKFLLATTDPQKLPLTILSRCLQFHLKTLDVEQICNQLKYILDAENIIYELRALQLLARAANGSLRDALNLTDQAISSGEGKLATEIVITMLGTLDEDQALSLIEAVINAKGERALSLVNDAAARGIDWETLLVEMLSLLHRLAILQLSPSVTFLDIESNEKRLRELARTVSPADIQLYYQILLIGRKELPFAPDRRMGVEMTLLRALAFHPRTPLPELETMQKITPTATPMPPTTMPLKSNVSLSDTTRSVLTARSQLQRVQCIQEATKLKESELATLKRAKPVNNISLKQLNSITERVQSHHLTSSILKQKASMKNEAYCRGTTATEGEKVKKIAMPKMPEELAAKLAEEAIARDSWTAEVSQLRLPKVVEQVALNTWKEQEGNQIHLHLRSSQKYLNSPNTQKILTEALTVLQSNVIELTIIEDDDLAVRTPLEWRQAIYEEKLAQAREAIFADNNIQTMLLFFDADLDEESIRPF